MGGKVPAGGLLGRILADALDTTLNPAGSTVILIAAFLVSLFLSTTFSFAWALGVLKPQFQFVSGWIERWQEYRTGRAREKARQRSEERKAPRQQALATPSVKEQTIKGIKNPRSAPAAVTPVASPAPSSRAAAAARQATAPEFPPLTLLIPPSAQIRINE